ncbi:hypothetical protein H0H92_004162 [Tricholoma furcatifolium]|nr:hypothetical protein H0H92_004162 [Tricholoma furcatifolium]
MSQPVDAEALCTCLQQYALQVMRNDIFGWPPPQLPPLSASPILQPPLPSSIIEQPPAPASSPVPQEPQQPQQPRPSYFAVGPHAIPMSTEVCAKRWQHIVNTINYTSQSAGPRTLRPRRPPTYEEVTDRRIHAWDRIANPGLYEQIDAFIPPSYQPLPTPESDHSGASRKADKKGKCPIRSKCMPPAKRPRKDPSPAPSSSTLAGPLGIGLSQGIAYGSMTLTSICCFPPDEAARQVNLGHILRRMLQDAPPAPQVPQVPHIPSPLPVVEPIAITDNLFVIEEEDDNLEYIDGTEMPPPPPEPESESSRVPTPMPDEPMDIDPVVDFDQMSLHSKVQEDTTPFKKELQL